MKRKGLFIAIVCIVFMLTLNFINADTDDHMSMTFIQTLSEDKTSVSIKGIGIVKEGLDCQHFLGQFGVGLRTNSWTNV